MRDSRDVDAREGGRRNERRRAGCPRRRRARWRRWWTRDVMVRIETAGGGASVEDWIGWMDACMHG